MMENTPGAENANIKELARQVDCFTDAEVAALAGVKESTLSAWRKRGQGPDYILLGCNYLYPRQALQTFLQSLIRKRGGVSAKQVLL